MGLIWFQIVDFVSKLINMFTLFLPPMAFGKSLGRVDYHCDRCPECPECQGPTALAGLHKVVPAMVVKFVGSVAGARLSNAAIFLQTLNILVHHVHL